ncbi:MAG: cation:proton antiporter [Candidatus Nitrosoabyssus spongiisocia]|nr:MAG: cation:proton antiporter [Nitrosopumilaceae archaeon AB1(1)]
MQNFLLQTQSEISSTVTSVFGNIVEQLQPELPHTGFVTNLAVIMIVAAITTLAFFKIRQPLIIGYLFAGMIIGPLSPLWSWLIPNSENLSTEGVGFLTDISAMNLFAEIGVILLLFVIGIEFPYAKIKSIGRMAVGVGTIGLFSTLGAVFYVATLLGLGFMDALFIGAALSISSTAIIVKLLEESGRIKKESSIMILGVLIIEDIIAVILISSLQSFALVGSVAIESVAVVIIIAASLIIGTFTIGTKIIPRLIDRVASAENREILLLSVLGVCFGYALLANIVGLSVAIGAFLAGVLVAESRSAEVAKVLSSPIKDMFVAIFFISVGALMDISQIYDYIVIAIILIAVTIAVKFGGSLCGNLIFGRERSKAMHSAFVLSAPRGEFSIVIIKAGIDIGAISAFLFPLIGVITIITSFITPLIFKLADKAIPKITGVENE